MKTRAATEADIPEIVAMGEPFWEQTQYAKTVIYDPDSMWHFCRVMMETGILLVAVEHYSEVVVGAAGAVIGPIYANLNHKVASELFWYIRPEYRNLGAGKALLTALEQAAVDARVNFLAMMVLVGAGDPERAEAIYLANGYQRAERTYMKVLPWPPSPEPQSPPQA